MQKFKGDALEDKMIACAETICAQLSNALSDFYSDAYQCQAFGDMIYESGRSPLSNAILQSIYRESFKQIFDAFVDCGSFEAYITVFKKIFGEDVDITFTIPAAGKLNIDIVAAGVEESNFIAREIVDNEYVIDEVLDQVDSENIVFQTIKGFQSQYELEQMLFEMVPAGIFTTITLDLGA